MSHELDFAYDTIDDLRTAMAAAGVEIPLSDDVSILNQPVNFGDFTVPNRLSIQPMEGCDGDSRGNPSDLTLRRYERFARGGAGLLWLEATAVTPEGRANPRQLMLHKDNLDLYRAMVQSIRADARDYAGHDPFLVLQMTHSGRYSKPEGHAVPIIAHHSEVLDPRHGLTADYPLVTDEYLDALQDKFVDMAILARDAGFNAVDIKSCHRYLIAELHASFNRENSRYGGSFENRTRFLRETAQKITDRVPELQVTCRLNAFDGIKYPFGFGVDRNDSEKPDLAEPLELIGQLQAIGFKGINITIGNPYSNPHVGRPYDTPIIGFEKPPVHPLKLVSRFVQVVRTIQERYPDLCVIGGGYTWLRQFFPAAAAAVLEKGWASIIGAGRNAFAYPEFALDLRDKGHLDPLKVCVTCSSCTQIMRDGGRSGCVLKDAAVYGPIFREGRRRAEDRIRSEAERCRHCLAPTCSQGCPARVDIPAFIREVGEGNYEEAYRILRKRNPLPELCALVCPTPETCEGQCIHEVLEADPVPISDIQYFVSKLAREEHFALPIADPLPYNIAIIGSGPSGLACADTLARAGCRVTLYEKEQSLGGAVRSQIPPEKIAFSDIDAEISYLIHSNPNITVETGRELGGDLDLGKLEDFDAVFLALGLGQGTEVLADKPPEAGVTDALSFLTRAKEGTVEMPDVIAVIGGGNTALDAAITAKRGGARDVYVFYRRTASEMPAWKAEYDQALAAGVNFMMLTQPVAYEAEEGKLTGVSLARTELGDPDESGRRRPEVLPGSEYFFPCDLLIEAAGQTIPADIREALEGIEFTERGLIKTRPDSCQTSVDRIFAGGDIISGGTTAVQGVAEGLAAGKEILAFLRKTGTE